MKNKRTIRVQDAACNETKNNKQNNGTKNSKNESDNCKNDQC